MASSPESKAIQAAASAGFPCSLFCLAEIKAATGYDVVVAKLEATPARATINLQQCHCVDGKKHVFTVPARKGEAAAALKMHSKIEDIGGPVTGIGDSAIGNQSGLAVVFGDDYVEVADESDILDDSVTLANVGLDKLKQMVLKVHAAK